MIQPQNRSDKNTLSRWANSISTTACVVLFTTGALSMLESQRYIMAAILLFFAFATPLLDEITWAGQLKSTSETGSHAASGCDTRTEVNSEEGSV